MAGSIVFPIVPLPTDTLRSSVSFADVKSAVRKSRIGAMQRRLRGDSLFIGWPPARVQHLYATINGELHNEAGEFDLLSALDPTTTVHGLPEATAREAISASEAFDRGLYGGTEGWLSGDGAEFAEAIQPSPSNKLEKGTPLAETSGLRKGHASSVQSKPSPKAEEGMSEGTCIHLYAGVDTVNDSNRESEWRELELKARHLEALLVQQSQPLHTIANINDLWAKLIVEECCRLGITYFFVAPGSQSSPIAAAAAANPRVSCVSCADEKALGFLAVGYGKGANKPAVLVTSSGTTVSNLLPAVIEASQDFVPLLVLTADTPAELYYSGAMHQPVDEGTQFGCFVRYQATFPWANDKLLAKMVLTIVDAAVNKAIMAPSGPAHINFPFREPLAGTSRPWNTSCLEGLDKWSTSSTPYTVCRKQT